MSEYAYPAVFTLEADGGFSIKFPDFPRFCKKPFFQKYRYNTI